MDAPYKPTKVFGQSGNGLLKPIAKPEVVIPQQTDGSYVEELKTKVNGGLKKVPVKPLNQFAQSDNSFFSVKKCSETT